MSSSGPSSQRPAVMLATADSIFTGILARHWIKSGLAVKVVTLGERGNWVPDDVEVINVLKQKKKPVDRLWTGVRPLGLGIQSLGKQLGLKRFQQRTGKPSPEQWEWAIWYWLENSWRMARVVRELNPQFVFGQEVSAYGLATALCSGCPKVLFPWGSDIFCTAESWFGADWMIRYALHHVDLIVPSATIAGEHIVERFHVAPDKVKPISWGIEPELIQITTSDRRMELKRKWGIPVDAVLVFNCRRFRPHWGSDVIGKAFPVAAQQTTNCHFLVMGSEEDTELREFQTQVNQQGLAKSVTILPRTVPFAEYCELAAMADLSTSIVPRGDMRSSSVLHAAATGAVPILGKTAEYETLVGQGFQAVLVDCGSPAEITNAIVDYSKSPEMRLQMAERNHHFLMKHENRERQLDLLLTSIQQLSPTSAAT